MADDFRDPVGVLVSTRLAVLAEQLRGRAPMREDVVRAAVDELMQLQAVRAPDADAAARTIIEPLTPIAQAARLEDIRALAVESFGRHRARMAGIREREFERSRFVERRALERRGNQMAKPTATRPAGAA